MKALAIIVCNTLNFISKLFGKQGSVIGGYWALKMNPNILKEIKYPKYVIGVSGSTGKGTTTSLIAGLLKTNRMSIAYNSEGSNAINGITSLILKNTRLNGKFKKDVLLMELDEKHSVNILKNFDLTHYIVTNITRDQPPRNVHPNYIFNEMKKNLRDDTLLIVNADDPISYKLSLGHKSNIFYGIYENEYSIPSSLNSIDAGYCPICGRKLNYNYYHYGHFGDYACPFRDFKRPELNVYADKINIKNRVIYINESRVFLRDEFMYTIYAYLGCYAFGKSINIEDKKIIEYFNDLLKNYKEPNLYELNGRPWKILVSKNENNLSYKQTLDYIVHDDKLKTVVLGFNSCSRRYSDNDLSWLWDIDFEELKNDTIDKIVIVGKYRYDILNRFIYAGIKEEKCLLVNDYTEELINVLKNTTGKIYSMGCFDTEIIIKDLLKKEGVKNDN